MNTLRRLVPLAISNRSLSSKLRAFVAKTKTSQARGLTSGQVKCKNGFDLLIERKRDLTNYERARPEDYLDGGPNAEKELQKSNSKASEVLSTAVAIFLSSLISECDEAQKLKPQKDKRLNATNVHFSGGTAVSATEKFLMEPN